MKAIGIVNLYLKFKVNLSNAKEVIALKWADRQTDGRTDADGDANRPKPKFG